MQINIEKKHAYILGILLLLVIGSFVFAGAANYLTGAAVSSGADSANAFGHDMVCVTASKTYGQTNAIIEESTDDIDYSVNSVISSASRAEIECKKDSGWIMTGCSAWAPDGKESMITTNGNGCKASDLDGNKIYVRCCSVG